MSDLNTASKELFAKVELGMHRFATRTSEAIDYQDKETGEKGLVWLLRNSLDDEVAEREFCSRIERLISLGLPIGAVRNYGSLDLNPYLFMEQIGGTKLSAYAGSLEEKLSLFREALRIIAACHSSGLYFSDICDDSFVVRPKGDLSFISVMGPFEGKNPRDNAPSQVFYYLSPEQRNGMLPQIQTDVFALGILGYRLFTGQYPVSKPQSHALNPKDDLLQGAVAPTKINPALPAWLDSLLGKCLAIKFNDRYENAQRVLIDFEQAANTGELVAEGRWSSSSLIVQSTKSGSSVAAGVHSVAQSRSSEGEFAGPQTFSKPGKVGKEKEAKAPKYMLLAGAGLLIGAIAAGLFYSDKKVVPKQKLEYVELLPPDLQAAVSNVLDDNLQESARLKALSQLTDSDNPATFSVLSALAKFPAARAIRTQVVQAVGTKLKDLGLGRSGEIIKSWSDRVILTGQDPAAFATFANYLKACDLTLPLTTRRDALHRASVDDSSGSLQLAAALSLDDPDTEHFVPVLRQLILGEALGQAGSKAASGEEDYKSVASLGLPSLFSKSRTLTITFEKDIQSLLPTTSDEDLRYMLSSFANVDSPLIYDAANEALRRRMVSGIAAIPMKALSAADRMSINKGTKLALINFSIGVFESRDIDAISRWTSVEFEPVLLSVCALAKNRELALEAFDVLASRNVDSEPAHELLKWFRTPGLWKNRKDLTASLGILGLYKLASEEELAKALDPLMPYAGSGKLFEIVIQLGEPRIIRMTLERVAPITSSDLLLALTKHADRGVRIGAVKSLQGRNEVRVLQDLVHGYEMERDPEVRKAYEENHWVVKNRG